MEKVVKGKLLVNDIKKLSPAEQTSALESYHNVVCHFAPKSLHFFYAPMNARLYIAALHFNEDSYRDQAVNKKWGANILDIISKRQKRCCYNKLKTVSVDF
uniref:Uncharacterized protein n=1 Tax=Magallana gigas TaxID=29159 RepID=A0A8W8KQ08_MAGGI